MSCNHTTFTCWFAPLLCSSPMLAFQFLYPAVVLPQDLWTHKSTFYQECSPSCLIPLHSSELSSVLVLRAASFPRPDMVSHNTPTAHCSSPSWDISLSLASNQVTISLNSLIESTFIRQRRHVSLFTALSPAPGTHCLIKICWNQWGCDHECGLLSRVGSESWT
jgi:hypothetical protein